MDLPKIVLNIVDLMWWYSFCGIAAIKPLSQLWKWDVVLLLPLAHTHLYTELVSCTASRRSVGPLFATKCHLQTRANVVGPLFECHGEPTSAGSSVCRSYLLLPSLFSSTASAHPVSSADPQLAAVSSGGYWCPSYLLQFSFSRPWCGPRAPNGCNL